MKRFFLFVSVALYSVGAFAEPPAPSLAVSRDEYMQRMAALNKKSTSQPTTAPTTRPAFDADLFAAKQLADQERDAVRQQLVGGASAAVDAARRDLQAIDYKLSQVRTSGRAAQADLQRIIDIRDKEIWRIKVYNGATSTTGGMIGGDFVDLTTSSARSIESQQDDVMQKYQARVDAAQGKIDNLLADQEELVQMRADGLAALKAAQLAVRQSGIAAEQAGAAKLAELRANAPTTQTAKAP